MGNGDKKRIEACSRCGSLEIRAPAIGEGGIPGSSEIAGVCYCRRCRRRIAPIIFENEEEYKEFLNKLKS